jgi:hypothetical protein
MTPFQRLGLYTAGAVVAGGLAWVTQNVGFYIGLAATVGGIILAAFATFEATQSLPAEPEEEDKPEVDAVLLRRRDRSEITRAADRARETDEEDLEDRIETG